MNTALPINQVHCETVIKEFYAVSLHTQNYGLPSYTLTGPILVTTVCVYSELFPFGRPQDEQAVTRHVAPHPAGHGRNKP